MSKDKMTNTPVQHKRTSVSGNIPDSTQLEVGELAINFPDQTLYTKDGEGQIIELGSVHDSALVQGQIDSNAYNYLQIDAFNFNNTGDIKYVQSTGYIVDDNKYRGVKVGSVYGPGADEGASVIFASTPGGKFMVNDFGVMLQEADLIVSTPYSSQPVKKGSAIGFWKISGMSLLGDSATIGTMAVDSATINKLTIGPDSVDAAKLYFDTEVSVHELEAVTDAGTDMDAWIGYPGPATNSWYSVAYGNGKFVAVARGGTNRVMYSEDGTNWTSATSADESGFWLSVTYGDGKFVAISEYSNQYQVMYSTDGINWTGATGADDKHYWKSVTYGNGKFVAVRDYETNRVMYSTDGINWTGTTSSNELNSWKSVTYGGGKFVAVGLGTNSVMYSTDGINWTGATSADVSTPADESLDWVSVTYGNGKFVAVSKEPGTNNVMYSEDGINWTIATSANEVNHWYSVTYGGGKFVAVASEGGSNSVMYSTDGINWTSATSANDGRSYWKGVTYGNGKFVAVGNYGTRVMVLEAPENRPGLFYDGELVATEFNLQPLFDKVNHLSQEIGGTGDLDSEGLRGYLDENFVSLAGDTMTGALYAPSVTIAPDSADAAKLYFDVDSVHELEAVEGAGTDMDAWIGYPASNESNYWKSVTYGNGKFVAVSLDGSNRVMYSEDGITWTGVSSSNESNEWQSVTYGDGKFVAIASSGTNRVMYSTDGINWTGVPSSNESHYWHSVTYGDGKFVAVSFNGSNRVMYSTDGINWTGATSAGESNSWYKVTYGNGKFVAVASSGTNRVMYSTDGINWTGATSSNESNSWYSVVYGNGKFVAVASSGTNRVMYSTDGINWTGVPSADESNYWKSVTYGSGKFVAVSHRGGNRVMYSEDGINWTGAASANDLNGWQSVTYGNGKFVAVSFNGSNRVMILDAPEDRSGLFYDGELIATEVNLQPLFDKVNDLSQNIGGTGDLDSEGLRGYLDSNFVSLAGDTMTGTLYAPSVETPSITSPSGTDLNLQYGGSTRIRIKSGEMELFEPGKYNSAVTAFVEASGTADTLIHKGYVDSVVASISASGHDSDLVQAQIDSAIANYNWNTSSGDFHDSALTGGQIDSALDTTQFISTVNGVGPTPGTNDIGIHGGNTQTDAGSGILIKTELDSKIKRITDTNTGQQYNPTNGNVGLPLVTDVTVQNMIDAEIDDLKFIDSADVATVVDPKLPFGSSAMGIVHASWDASAGTTTPSILSSYGVSGITRIATGEYRVDFMTNFVNANYTVTTGCGTTDYSGTGASPRTVSVLSRANSSVTVLCERTDDAVNEDNAYMSIMIMGNQVS